MLLPYDAKSCSSRAGATYYETPHRRELPRRLLRALLRHPRARPCGARRPGDRMAAIGGARRHDRPGEARPHRLAVGRADARPEGPQLAFPFARLLLPRPLARP